MTQRFLLTLAFLIFSIGQSSIAQTAIGFQGGLNWSKYDGENQTPGTVNNEGTASNYGALGQLALGHDFAFVVNVSFIDKLVISDVPGYDGQSYAHVETHYKFTHYSILLKKEFPIQSFSPYVLFGPSYEDLKSVNSTIRTFGMYFNEDLTTSSGPNHLTIDIGVGAQYAPLTNLCVFVDGRYSFAHNILSAQLWSGFMFTL